MNARLTSLLCLALVACEGAGPDSGSDTDTDTECVTVEADGCACGWSKARSSGMLFAFLTVDGLSQNTTYESENTYDGVPAACIRDDRRAAQWIFEVGGEAYGKLTLGSTLDGDYLTDEAGTTLSLDLFGHTTPTVFTGSSFSNGQLTYNTGNLDVEGLLRGNALSSDSVSLQLNVTADGSL